VSPAPSLSSIIIKTGSFLISFHLFLNSVSAEILTEKASDLLKVYHSALVKGLKAYNLTEEDFDLNTLENEFYSDRCGQAFFWGIINAWVSWQSYFNIKKGHFKNFHILKLFSLSIAGRTKSYLL